MPKFGILGLGYIAPRHIQAIESIGGELLLAYNGSPVPNIQLPNELQLMKEEADFFQNASALSLDFISICSPTFLHKQHIIKSLQIGANAIVEKPLCLTKKELKKIKHAEKATGKRAFSIFQLRHHPIAQEIANADNKTDKNEVRLVYRGNRNQAYFDSWKGDITLSGGVFAAVGVHYFDLLIEQFGEIQQFIFGNNSAKKSEGTVELERAVVSWDFEFIPEDEQQIEVKRQFIINQKEIDGSAYAKDLHSLAYKDILNGKGITANQAEKTIELVSQLV